MQTAASSISPDSMLASYNRDGYWIEPNVFSAEECDRLIHLSPELDNFKNGTLRPQMMPHRTHTAYLQALKNPKIITIMEQLIGGKVSALQTEFFFCPPGTRGFSNHQDNFFVEAEYGQFASAWCALEDATPENGGLIAYPGTHKEGQLPVVKTGQTASSSQDPNANNEEVVIPPQYQPLHATVPKGSVFFIHGHLVHGSNENRSANRHRRVLLCTYVRKGGKFRPGKYAGREEVDVYS